MSVREAINGKPIVGIAFTGLLLIAAVCTGYRYLGRPSEMSRVGTAFFTDDNGQSYYRDNLYDFPPHPHGGSTAVYALVFSDGQNNFVGILERFTPDAQKRLQDEYAKVQSGSETLSQLNGLLGSGEIREQGIEVKAPGAGNDWNLHSKAGDIKPKSPSGSPCWMIQP